MIIRLLEVSDLQRTWSVNSAESEFDIRDMDFGKKSDGNNEDEHGDVVETGILLLGCCTLFIREAIGGTGFWIVSRVVCRCGGRKSEERQRQL